MPVDQNGEQHVQVPTYCNNNKINTFNYLKRFKIYLNQTKTLM